MRALLAALCALSFGQGALADKVQPFVDYAMLLDMYADKVTTDQPDVGKGLGAMIAKDLAARSLVQEKVRFLDLGNGLQFYCKGLEGSDCDAFNRDHAVVDIGCTASGLALHLREADLCDGVLTQDQAVEFRSMMDQSMDYLARNALPPRESAAVKAAAFAVVDDRIKQSLVDDGDLCTLLGDKDGIDWKLTQSNIQLVLDPRFAAHFSATLEMNRLPVTSCGEQFGSVAK